ncbi:MAG: phosphotransferase, partial [Chloroflexota bacterium]|nr:phosphotransferase [Chloroflexota bacterium]
MEELGDRAALAQAAFTLYDVGPGSVTPVRSTEYAKFDVRAESGDRYRLRLHPPQGRDPIAIRSELLWLAALHTEAGLVVPEPVATRTGELSGTVRGENAGTGRFCVLFRGEEGRSVGEADLTPETFQRAGAAIGRMHAYAEWWRPPSRFQRERLDVGVMGSPRFVVGGLAGG